MVDASPSKSGLLALLPPLRVGRPALPELVLRRAGGEAMGEQQAAPAVAVAFTEIAGVSCVVCTPADPQGVLIHLHGGGYRLGSARAWRPFGTRLAAASGLQVVLPNYRLAPEAPFPAALHDALGVLEAVCSGRGADRVILGGDSAGGGLAMATALAAGQAGVRVAGATLMSPWLDLTNTAATFQTCAATDRLFSHASASEAAEAYLQGCAATDPLASPLFGDLRRAPPTLVMASASEVLLHDSLALASGLALAGRAVQLHVVEDQPHVWPVLAPEQPAASHALRQVADFARDVLGGGRADTSAPE